MKLLIACSCVVALAFVFFQRDRTEREQLREAPELAERALANVGVKPAPDATEPPEAIEALPRSVNPLADEQVDTWPVRFVATPPRPAASNSDAAAPMNGNLTFEQAIAQLQRTKELRYVADREGQRYLNAPRREANRQVASRIVKHPVLSGLPWRQGTACAVEGKKAERLAELSSELRQMFSVADIAAARSNRSRYESLYNGIDTNPKQLAGPGAAKLLTQMLEGEDLLWRGILVRMLHEIEGKESSECLARIAVFDVEPDMRGLAIDELMNRHFDEWQSVALAGLRHVWQPAAVNAAKALMATKAVAALPSLVAMLDAADPSRPFLSPEYGTTPMVRQLVRLNHNHNCIVCHAVASSADSSCVVRSPSPEQPLRAFPSVLYYGDPRLDGELVNVRFDITYLRQDFSARLPYDLKDNWPRLQRYDFITQVRAATDEELQERPVTKSYPQRDAILLVLRKLTGQDGGDSKAEWERISRNRLW
jgi:hypothetical protein